MRERLIVFLVLVGYGFAPAFSQSKVDFDEVLQVPIYYPEINPESPIGIFALDLPFYFSSANPQKHQLSVGYTMANIWHPQARFLYPQNLTGNQKNELKDIYMSWRPEYFEVMKIDTKDKLFQFSFQYRFAPFGKKK